MIRNPIDVLFGRDVVSLLHKQPGALKRIAATAKPLLIASVHPDRNPESGHEAAAEISEAFERLEAATPEDLKFFTDEYLSNERQTGMRSELRDLRKTTDRLRAQAMTRDEENKTLKASLSRMVDAQAIASVTTWMWIANGCNFSEKGLRSIPIQILPKGAIPRGSLHEFRIVLEHKERFVALEVDPSLKVRFRVDAESIEDAREVGVYRGKYPERNGSEILSGGGLQILGSTPNQLPKGTLMIDAVRQGLVNPFITVGSRLMFINAVKYDDVQKSPSVIFENEIGAKVIELIPLKKLRAGAMNQYRKPAPHRLISLATRLQNFTSFYKFLKQKWTGEERIISEREAWVIKAREEKEARKTKKAADQK